MNRKPKFCPGFIVFLILVLSYSCAKNKNELNGSFYDFNDKGIETAREYVFYPFMKMSRDSLEFNKYDLMMVVRYSDKCEVKELPVNIEISSYNKDSISFNRLSLVLFDDENLFLNKKGFGFYEVSFPVLENIPFDEGLTIAISTKEKETRGIVALGIIVTQN